MPSQSETPFSQPEKVFQAIPALERKLRLYPDAFAKEAKGDGEDSRWHRNMEAHAAETIVKSLGLLLMLKNKPSLNDLWKSLLKTAGATLESMPSRRWKDLRARVQRLSPEGLPDSSDEAQERAGELALAFHRDLAEDRVMEEEHAVDSAVTKSTQTFLALQEKGTPVHPDDLLRALAAHSWALHLHSWIDALVWKRDRSMEIPKVLHEGIREALRSMEWSMDPTQSLAPSWGPFQEAVSQAIKRVKLQADRPLALPDRPMEWILPVLQAQATCFETLQSSDALPKPMENEERIFLCCSAIESWKKHMRHFLPQDKDDLALLQALQHLKQQAACLKLVLRIGSPGSFPRSLDALSDLESLMQGKASSEASQESLSQAVSALSQSLGRETAPLYEKLHAVLDKGELHGE